MNNERHQPEPQRRLSDGVRSRVLLCDRAVARTGRRQIPDRNGRRGSEPVLHRRGPGLHPRLQRLSHSVRAERHLLEHEHLRRLRAADQPSARVRQGRRELEPLLKDQEDSTTPATTSARCGPGDDRKHLGQRQPRFLTESRGAVAASNLPTAVSNEATYQRADLRLRWGGPSLLTARRGLGYYRRLFRAPVRDVRVE